MKKTKKTDTRPWWVYVLLCHTGRTYTGMALDVEARYKKHVAGRAAVFTRMNKPVCVLAARKFGTRSDAASEEKALKRADLYWVKRWCRNNLWPAPRTDAAGSSFNAQNTENPDSNP